MDNDDTLKRIRERIQGLRAKTVDRGCTEQEALAAANKVSSLLERYGMLLSEIDFPDHRCEKIIIPSHRRRGCFWDPCILVIADFCDCRVWKERDSERKLQTIFFGFPGDVEAARYLYDLVVITFQTETTQFKLGMFYKSLPRGRKRHGSASFQMGLADGINEKLRLLKTERDLRLKSSGTDLVLLKTSIVREEFEKLGLYLRKKRVESGKQVVTNAYSAGHFAGVRFEKAIGK